MALAAIALVTAGAGVVSSIKATDAANAQAAQTNQQEQQLLSEANQQVENEQNQQALIANRNAQEETLLEPNSKFTADNTILTPPQLASSVSQNNGQRTQLLGG